MQKKTARLLYIALLWLIVATAAWPAFVLAGTLLALYTGEARQIDAWALEPRALLLADFLDGWRNSALVSALLGVVAIVDYILLSRYRVTWLIGGILLPLAGSVIAFTLYRDPVSALPTLVVAGVLLAFPYRVVERVRHSLSEA